MKPPYKAIVLVPAAALLLAACQHSSQETAASPASDSSDKSAPAATTAPATADVLRVTQSNMAACHPAAGADVRWDASRHAGVNTVQIDIGTGSSEKLFAEGGATGDAKTGPWVRPGTVFTAKAKASGKMLGTVTVAGPTCPSAG